MGSCPTAQRTSKQTNCYSHKASSCYLKQAFASFLKPTMSAPPSGGAARAAAQAYQIWRHPHLKLVDKCLQYAIWLSMRLDKLDSVAKLAGPEGAKARKRMVQFNTGTAARIASKHWITTLETTSEGVEVIVYSPKHLDGGVVPVVLWLHGGGFTIGGARDAFGAELCAAAVQAGAPPFAWALARPLGPCGPGSSPYMCLHSSRSGSRDPLMQVTTEK